MLGGDAAQRDAGLACQALADAEPRRPCLAVYEYRALLHGSPPAPRFAMTGAEAQGGGNRVARHTPYARSRHDGLLRRARPKLE